MAAVPEEQADDLRQIADQHRQVGYASTLVQGTSAREHMRRLFPDWRAEGIAAVLHEHRGGWAEAPRTLAALAGMARSLGVRIVEGVEVLGFHLDGEAVERVETSVGSLSCDLVVVAPGPWAREIWRLLDLPGEVDLGGERRPMFRFFKVREGDYSLPGGPALEDGCPVVHLDLYQPLYSDRDGRLLDPGPWGIYFRSTPYANVAVGGLPAHLDPDCELDPYGPSHPVHGLVEPGFDEWLTSGLAAALGRFRGRTAEMRSGVFGAQVCFTPDGYPVCGFVRDNVYAVLDSNHGFKMLALGKLAAREMLGGREDALAPFRPDRFARAELHPVSRSPYPWT